MIAPREVKRRNTGSFGRSVIHGHSKFIQALVVGVCLLAALAGSSSRAAAQQPQPILDLGFEPSTIAGKEIVVSAYLYDPIGNPIYDAEINFSYDAEFMNVSNLVEIGTAITDENGLALLLFEPRTEGENNVSAKFAGNDVFASIAVADTLEVLPGGQIYRELSPYRIPGANVWFAAGIITTVWTIFILSLGLVGWANYKARKDRAGSNA